MRIEITASLVVQSDLHRRALDPLPGERLTSTGNHIEQGRLPRTVGADDAEALAATEQKIEPRDQRRLVVVADRHVVEFDDLVTEPRCALVHRVEIEITIASGGLGSGVDQGGRSLDPGLALSSAGLRPGAEPGEFPASQILAGVLCCRSSFLASGSSLEIPVVTALVNMARPSIELEHTGSDPIEHVAIMGDDHEPAREVLEFVLQPLDRIDVEMVGRLVEHEQVGIGDQCPGQRDPLLLPTRELVHRPVDHLRQAEAMQRRLAPPATSDRVAHTAGWKGRDLIDGGHGDTTTSTNRAGLRLAGAGDDRQQGRLAGAVDADHAQPVAARYRDGDIGEQRPQRAAHADTFDVDEDHVAQTTTYPPTSLEEPCR